MAIGVPWLINRWQFHPPLFGLEWGPWLGAVTTVVGGALLTTAIVWFAREGVKPYPPIERVVTTGPYAYVRNPMYVGVVMVMVGQGLLFGSLPVFVYGVAWLTAFAIFVRTIDDPFIIKRIGQPYHEYLESVPEWIPRRPRRHGSRSSS